MVSPAAAEELEAAVGEVDRLAHTVDELLVLSGAGERQTERNGRSISGTSARSTAASVAAGGATARASELTYRRASAPATAWAAWRDVERALDALIENAINYSPSGCAVESSPRRGGSRSAIAGRPGRRRARGRVRALPPRPRRPVRAAGERARACDRARARARLGRRGHARDREGGGGGSGHCRCRHPPKRMIKDSEFAALNPPPSTLLADDAPSDSVGCGGPARDPATAALAWSASQLAGQHIGLSSAPLSVAAGTCAPPARRRERAPRTGPSRRETESSVRRPRAVARRPAGDHRRPTVPSGPAPGGPARHRAARGRHGHPSVGGARGHASAATRQRPSGGVHGNGPAGLGRRRARGGGLLAAAAARATQARDPTTEDQG